MPGKTLYPRRIPLFVEGDDAHKEGSSISVPGSETELISYVVPVGKTFNMLGAYASCFQDGTMRVRINSSVVCTSRTGPGCPGAYFFWIKPRKATGGQTVRVGFEAIAGSSPSDVEAYLDAALTDS